MLMVVKTNQGKKLQLRGVVRRILVLKLKKAKATLMELLKVVMEIMLLEKIMKNSKPMKIMIMVKNNQGKLVEARRMVVIKQKKIMSWLKKDQMMMEMMNNQGKKTKEMVMELMNVVMEITTLVKIVKNPVPMKKMMVVNTNQEKKVKLRRMIRRMVVMKKKKMMSQIKTTKQTAMEMEEMVMEMMVSQGKMVELMVVERRIVVMKKKQMMSRIKKTKQMVKKMMDVVMEEMAVMIIMMKIQ
jgi:hypothetical protein